MPPNPALRNLENIIGNDYDKVFSLLHTGIAIFDRDGRFLYCNEAFLKMFNLPKDIKGRHVLEYFVTGEAGVMTTLRTGKPTFCVSLTTDKERGIAFRYPLFDENGEVCGVIIESISPSIGTERMNKLLEIVSELEKKSNYYEQKSLPKTGALCTFDGILGQSAPIRDLKLKAQRFARSNEAILILGESGVGKELLAQAIHAASPRARQPFVVVNCAALPGELMEAELFGYEKGAFTGANTSGSMGKFELANKGTIFMDEIGELPMSMQAKLLRVLESGEIQKLGHKGSLHSDFRLIAATNRNLALSVKQGKFREDLYHRLNILELEIPPLRTRLDDIPVLSRHFIRQHAGELGARDIHISPELYRLFRQAPWPGNIRELKNVLTFAIFNLENDENILRPRHLPARFLEEKNEAEDSQPPETSEEEKAAVKDPHPKKIRKFDEAAENAESVALQEAMREAHHNKSLAAKILGISRNKLYRKMKRFGLLGPRSEYQEENWG